MDADYDPTAIDDFAKLKERFTSFGGLTLKTDDEERFFVAYKLEAKRWEDEESLFNELCSHALNGDRERGHEAAGEDRTRRFFKPKPLVQTPTRLSFARTPTSARSDRGVLNELENVSTPRTSRYVPLSQPKRQPDSPISTEPTNKSGHHFAPIDLRAHEAAELVVRSPKSTDDLFFYGKRFTDEVGAHCNNRGVMPSFRPFQTARRPRLTIKSPTRRPLRRRRTSGLEISGRLLLQRNESGDETIVIKSGKLRLPVGRERTFRLLLLQRNDGNVRVHARNVQSAEGECLHPPKALPMASLNPIHDSLRVLVIQGLMLGAATEEAGEKRVEWVVGKVLSTSAHALVLDSAVISVFPTPPMSFADFGWPRSRPANVHLLTDPAVFDLNGVRFGVTCSQAIWMLAAAEKFQGSTQEDRMTRLCGHMLDQRSLCPAFLHSRVPVLREDFRPHLSERPHFVIAPCNLVSFAKSNQNVAFVNPQFCGKNVMRFAQIDVNLRKAREHKQAPANLNVFDFSQVELQKEIV
ncbi:DNA polymerase alpha subunit B [Aphelenchoides fujianensis]|nr:DNA polymerase alpha subunit B [Aphelenchoides fujianensis]